MVVCHQYFNSYYNIVSGGGNFNDFVIRFNFPSFPPAPMRQSITSFLGPKCFLYISQHKTNIYFANIKTGSLPASAAFIWTTMRAVKTNVKMKMKTRSQNSGCLSTWYFRNDKYFREQNVNCCLLPPPQLLRPLPRSTSSSPPSFLLSRPFWKYLFSEK